jgi:adenosylhomocysteine nucleosidase
MKKIAEIQIAVLVSARAEWDCVCRYYQDPTLQQSPAGPYFFRELANRPVLLMHSGWGKVASAAATQYLIDNWHPELLINIGTCGGFSGSVEVGETILANETLIYDIYERMTDPRVAIDHYTTPIDLGFLCEPYPQEVRITRLLSADQDIDPDLIFKLTGEYQAVAADWESGAIAWTANRNHTNCLILRVVSDLVDVMGGELYNQGSFAERTNEVLTPLIRALPNWIRCASWGGKNNPSF